MNRYLSLLLLAVLSQLSLSTHAATVDVVAANVVQDTYYVVRPDFRRCVSPICGGWFIKAVNRRVMTCPDGSVRAECYVSTEAVKIPNLTAAQQAELKQAMSESKVLVYGSADNSVPYGLLTINRAWLAATATPPEDVFVNLRNNGIVCITSPCPSYDASILNRTVVKPVAEYDLKPVGATQSQLDFATKAIASDEGLPLAGRFFEVTGVGGTALGISANQFYLELVGEQPKICFPTGCSGQICSDTNIISTCEWRPEYACYQSATCSAQRTGECGWVMDDALRQCLNNAATGTLLQNLVQ